MVVHHHNQRVSDVTFTFMQDPHPYLLAIPSLPHRSTCPVGAGIHPHTYHMAVCPSRAVPRVHSSWHRNTHLPDLASLEQMIHKSSAYPLSQRGARDRRLAVRCPLSPFECFASLPLLPPLASPPSNSQNTSPPFESGCFQAPQEGRKPRFAIYLVRRSVLMCMRNGHGGR